MKSYEEMTSAVLLRAGEERAAQKRKNRKIVVAAVCLVFVGLVVFAGSMISQPAGDGETRNPRVSLFCLTASASEQRQQMLKGEKLPYNAVIRVRDIRGLSALEKVKLENEDRAYVRNMMMQYTDASLGNCTSTIISSCSDRVMMTTLFVGSFYLTVDDYSQIRDINITTTEIGSTVQTFTDFYDESLRDGIGIKWSLSESGLDMFENDPGMALSELTDTITVTVEFTDGTKEIAVIEITVDDDGQIYGTFKGVDVIG